MDTMSALVIGMANCGKEEMVFDWDAAARIIKERGAERASAGLCGDWEWTGGEILRDGKPYMDGGTFLVSTWATPEIEIDGETIDCFRMMSDAPGWESDTVWPQSALDILNGVSE